MRKRSTYRPKDVRLDAVQHAIAGAGVMHVSLQNRLQVVEIRALDAFKEGTATDEQVEVFAGVCFVAEMLAKERQGLELLEVCKRAEAAVEQCRRRFSEHGKVGRAAGEYETFAELCELHSLQRKSVSQAQYEQAMLSAMRAAGMEVSA